MADVVSVEKRSQMMAGIKGKNTKPELLVRQALHSRGFRFRPLPLSHPPRPLPRRSPRPRGEGAGGACGHGAAKARVSTRR